MGYVKVRVIAPGKVKLVHQLDGDGKAYAEDVTVEAQEGAPASRVDYLAQHDGKIGYANVSFSPAGGVDASSVKFPEDLEPA